MRVSICSSTIGMYGAYLNKSLLGVARVDPVGAVTVVVVVAVAVADVVAGGLRGWMSTNLAGSTTASDAAASIGGCLEFCAKSDLFEKASVMYILVCKDHYRFPRCC